MTDQDKTAPPEVKAGNKADTTADGKTEKPSNPLESKLKAELGQQLKTPDADNNADNGVREQQERLRSSFSFGTTADGKTDAFVFKPARPAAKADARNESSSESTPEDDGAKNIGATSDVTSGDTAAEAPEATVSDAALPDASSSAEQSDREPSDEDKPENSTEDAEKEATMAEPEVDENLSASTQARSEVLHEFGGPSAIAALEKLLDALEWTGSARHLKEVLPHFDIADDVDSVRAVLARLNYASFDRITRLKDIAPGELPCILVDDDGECHVLLSYTDDGKFIKKFDGITRQTETVPANRTKVRIYMVTAVNSQAVQRKVLKFGWVATVAGAFRGLFIRLLAINFLINLSALAVPIFIMAVYGTAIASKSFDTLIALASGILIVLAADWMLRRMRSRALAYIGARFDSLLAINVFQQLLYMPLTMTQSAPLGTQITRIKQFDGIRNLFTGAFGTAVLDLPFMLIFLTVIGFIGGWLVMVPLALMAAYLVLAILTLPAARRYALDSAGVRAERQNMLVETFSKHRAIRDNGIEDIWLERFGKLNAEHTAISFRVQQLNLRVQTISQTLMMLSGVGTLTIGTLLVLNQVLSIGGLIGSMALVWRVLAPIQTAFLSLYRIGQVVESVKQINRMMTIKTERQPGVVPTIFRRFIGQLTVAGVSFRYPLQTEPALKGIAAKIEAGEIVAITGASGSGKTTMLRTLAGLYSPQAGAIQIDGLDLRQLDMGEYRAEIGYVPDVAEFFYGTVAQNLRFSNPTARREDLERALVEAGISLPCTHMPDGLETRLNAKRLASLSDSYKQQLLLARAYVKNASVMMMDEPANFLDNRSDQLFMDKLSSLKGKSTVLFTTQRPSHMKLADRVLVLHEGMLVMNEVPDKVIPALYGGDKKSA
ncbi:ATP-binding cassette domain-containing protein [Coralliovum pocilloporae]|uniref:ATP-binding cassette domain-containing protein n=1 Tax=Coralliovum pocilloporae TaxID=3066369 RepID=UPI00330760C1